MLSKAERTKQFIIEKAAAVFNEKGYAGTSMNDLTIATGLTKGSIYGNFENKDDIAIAAFDHNFQLLTTYIKQQMETQISVIDKLMVYPKTYRQFWQLPFLQGGCPLANTATEADDTHPALKTKAAFALQFWRNAVEYRLQTGIDTGEIKPDTNITEFVAVLTSVIQGSVLQAKVSGNLLYLNASMNFMERMINDLRT
ncbi:MAG: TetR/AcrR family transcriptional regulator [Fluviicola sp.]|nr:TetR/AcrR family transcriptional regulator [Fluviicola sp.]